MCDQSFLQKHSGSDPSALSSLGLNQDKQREKDPDLEQSDAKSLMRLDDSHYKDKSFFRGRQIVYIRHICYDSTKFDPVDVIILCGWFFY